MSLDVRGIIPPLLTPLSPDRQVDIESLHRLVDHVIAGGVNGLFILGTTGEGPWLSDAQCRVVVRETVSAARKRVPVLVGLLQPSTPRVLDMLEWVQRTDADAVVITTPYYYEADAATQEAHIRTIARASALPVVIYNIPSKTNIPLLLSVVKNVLAEPNIVALKDSSADFVYFSDVVALCHERPGFRVLQGAERQSLAALRIQGDGLVAGLCNLVPEWFANLWAAQAANQAAQAEILQARIDALWEIHTQVHWLTALKYAASLLGLCAPLTVAHHFPLDDATRQAIERIVRQNGALPPTDSPALN